MRTMLVSLAVAMLAACGTPDPGTNDSSTVIERDAGTTPVVDVPETDSATTTVDTTPAPSNCWAQACGMQDTYTVAGTRRENVDFSCDMTTQRIALAPAGLGCLAPCNGDVCTCEVEDSDGVTAILENIHLEDGSCGPRSQLSYRRNGNPMTPSPSSVNGLMRRSATNEQR